jgi:hypothetical protein
LQVKSDGFLLFMNNINKIDKKWGFFVPSVQKTLDFQYYGGGRGRKALLPSPGVSVNVDRPGRGGL